jgi:signal transduction histidine kinase
MDRTPAPALNAAPGGPETSQQLRRRAADRDAFRVALSDALRPLTDPVAIQSTAAELLGRHLGVDRAYYAELDLAGQRILVRQDFCHDLPSVAGEYPLNAFGASAVATLRGGDTRVIPDTVAQAGLLPNERDAYVAAQVRAIIAVPIFQAAQWVSVLCVAQGEPRTWTPDEVALVRDTGERTWAAVERAHAELALRKSEEKYRTLFESIDEAVTQLELIRDEHGTAIDFRIVEINRHSEAISGLPNQLGRTGTEIHGSMDAEWLAPYDQVARTGETARFERYLASSDRWLRVTASRLEGQVSDRVLVVYDNITERKRAEIAARHAEERQTYLLRLSDTLRQHTDSAAFHTTATVHLGRYLHASRAYYCEIDATIPAITVLPDYCDKVASIAGVYPIDAFSPTVSSTLLAGQTMVVEDTMELPYLTPAEREAFQSVGVIAFVAAPIVRRENWVAMLAVAQDRPRQWTEEEIALVRETAARTEAAAERAHGEAGLVISERKYRDLFETVDQGIAVVDVRRDAKGRATGLFIVDVNPACQRLIGIEPLAGRAADDVIAGLEPFWLELLDRVARSGNSETFERYLPAVERWLGGSVSRSGTVGSDRLLVIFHDITHRRMAELARQREEERQSYLLALSDALRPLDDPLAIQRAAAELLARQLDLSRVMYGEVTADDEHIILSRSFHRGTDPFEGTHHLNALGIGWVQRLRGGDSVIVFDIAAASLLSAAERAAYLDAGLRAIVMIPLVKERRLVGLLLAGSAEPREWGYDDVILLRETVERTWAAAERALAELALRDADRRKDEFLAMLAHELRNPLAPIQNGARIMRSLDGSEDIRAAAAMVERQVAHMARLVDDLLDASRISQGKIVLKLERVELSAVVNLAIERARPVLQRFGHGLRLSTPSSPVMVEADSARLAQSIDNLLNNAAKFTDPGGQIELIVARDGADAVITVRDQGVGIAPHQLPSIFDLFMQADTSLERVTSGLGIGLTLVKRLVELHGGSVEARSEGLGRGSEFVIRLPACPVEASSRPAPVPERMAPVSPRRVLVVDDNRDGADSLTTLLQLGGHDTRTAFDGLQALEVAASFHPEVVLLDIGLPRLNGYETCRRMRAEPWGRDIVIVALTGWGQDDFRRESEKAGFNFHFVKPVSLDQLSGLFHSLGTSPAMMD